MGGWKRKSELEEKKGNGERGKFRVNQRDSVWRAEGAYLIWGFSQKKNKEEVDRQQAERK